MTMEAKDTAAVEPQPMGRMSSRSGQMIGWDTGPPPLDDVLVQLGRIPRFRGATGPMWTVLQHSYHVHRLACALNYPPSVCVAALLHDFAEIMTGDVPTPLKPAEWRPLERAWVERAAEAWGIPWPDGAWAAINWVDTIALHLEGAGLIRGEWFPERVDPSGRLGWHLKGVLAIGHHPDWGPVHVLVRSIIVEAGVR